MQFISKKWYEAYNWILVGLSIAFVIFFIVSKVAESKTNLASNYDLTLQSAVFSLIVIGYGTAGFVWISKRINAWFGSLITTMLFAMFLINQIASNPPNIYIYIFIWWFLALYAGALGIVIVLGINLITVMVLLLKSNTVLSSLPTSFVIMFVGTVVFSTGAYLLFWRPKFKNSKTGGNINDLEGMPQDNQKQNETLVESIGDGIVVTSTDGKIVLINPAASEMTEWALPDAIGVDVNLVLKLSSEDGREMPAQNNPFNLVKENNKKLESSALLSGHRGKKLIISLTVSAVSANNEIVGYVGVLHDVSAARAAEKQRADFISTASHEMRTPIAAIEGYLSLALNPGVSSVDAKARDFLEKAHQSTQQLGKLFQDLLTSSKAEDGRLSNHPEVVEMSEFIEHLAETFQLAAQPKRLLVDFTVASTNTDQPDPTGKVIRPLYYVHVDPERIREVVTNIFDNSVKYTQTGKITVGLGGDAQMVHLYIRDTGVGIPADDIPHLFQKFYRVDNSSVRTIGGTGLGLYICKKIVELYGGQIWVTSELGKGSVFHIALPRLTTQNAEALLRSEASSNEVSMPQPNLTL